jgi:dolichol-phosphate mannosyltransferase
MLSIGRTPADTIIDMLLEHHERLRIFCVIPAYRARTTILTVVSQALAFADGVIVVDDGCPERSGTVVRNAYSADTRVHVLMREANGGVGAAVKTGIAFCIEQEADVVVKIDADAQMDCAFIPVIRQLFTDDLSLVCVKGNRFFDASVLQFMPKSRLFGNAVLSLMAKFASGYWNVIDPTNGYLAFNLHLLRLLPWQSFADSYFFELSVLCELGLRRLPLLELEMPTIYNSAPSSLSISRVMLEFPPRLLRRVIRRVTLQYFVFDINLGSLYLTIGTLLLLFGLIFGGYEWIESSVTHIPRQLGTIMVAALTFLIGFQLFLNALMHDVQFGQKTSHELLVDTHRRRAGHVKTRRTESA